MNVLLFEICTFLEFAAVLKFHFHPVDVWSNVMLYNFQIQHMEFDKVEGWMDGINFAFTCHVGKSLQ